MQLRLFPSGGWPTEEFKRDLKALLSLDPSQLDRLSDWFKRSRKFIPLDWTEVSTVARDMALDPEEFDRIMKIARWLLNLWTAQELSLDDVLADLRSLGYDEDTVQKTAVFLGGLQEVRARVHRDVLKNIWESLAIPTVDDVNITCDARPIFQDYAYAETPRGETFQNLLGFSYVVILEFIASRSDDKSESTTFQFSEEDFAKLLDGLNKAKKQLEILKATLGSVQTHCV